MIFSPNKEKIIEKAMFQNIPDTKKDLYLRNQVYIYTQELLLNIMKDTQKTVDKRLKDKEFLKDE